MSRLRPFPIDRSMPRYNIRLVKGHGQLIGVAWSEPWGRRYAARLAEERGQPVNLFDTWRRRLIRSYRPSREAVERAKARAKEIKARRTEGGFDGAVTHYIFAASRRPKEAAPLSDRAENPEALPLRPALPGDILLDADPARPVL